MVSKLNHQRTKRNSAAATPPLALHTLVRSFTIGRDVRKNDLLRVQDICVVRAELDETPFLDAERLSHGLRETGGFGFWCGPQLLRGTPDDAVAERPAILSGNLAKLVENKAGLLNCVGRQMDAKGAVQASGGGDVADDEIHGAEKMVSMRGRAARSKRSRMMPVMILERIDGEVCFRARVMSAAAWKKRPKRKAGLHLTINTQRRLEKDTRHMGIDAHGVDSLSKALCTSIMGIADPTCQCAQSQRRARR